MKYIKDNLDIIYKTLNNIYKIDINIDDLIKEKEIIETHIELYNKNIENNKYKSEYKEILEEKEKLININNKLNIILQQYNINKNIISNELMNYEKHIIKSEYRDEKVINKVILEHEELLKDIIYKIQNKEKEELNITIQEDNNKIDILLEDINNKILEINNNYNIIEENNKENKYNLELQNIKNEIVILKNKEELYNTENKLLEELTNNIENNIKMLQLYIIYQDIVSETGIKTIILDNFISIIEKELNKYLTYFTNDNFYLYRERNNESDKTNKKIIFYRVNTGGAVIDVKNSSNYEKVMISCIFKNILHNLNISSKSNLILIDESLDVIANKNYDKITKIFDILEKKYNNIFVISHNNEIKELLYQRTINKYDIRIESDGFNSYIK